ncbi:type VII secretion integral membrane protein EccD [Pseudonocardiaceae bacterium YIM PH 21723]|nr:type VII secretion integral membrane protein EccD [Pseudonocardiaceae bacterium YIM PH 21723]
MATGTTVFSRVTVVAPRTRIDVALPANVSVADLLPMVLGMAKESPQDPVARQHGGWVLAKLGEGPLDPSHTIATLGVTDGDMLQLRRASENPPPPLYDDVVDAIAESDPDTYRPWTKETAQKLGHIAGSLALFVAAIALLLAGPVTAGAAGLGPAIAAGVSAVLALIFGSVVARSYQAPQTGVLIAAAGGLPMAFVAGLYIVPVDPGQTVGRYNLLLACVLTLVFAAASLLIIGRGVTTFIAVAIASTIGAIAALVAALMPNTHAAAFGAGMAAFGVMLLSSLPRLTIQLAKLPLPQVPTSAEDLKEDNEFADFAVIEHRADLAHSYLTGLMIGCGAAAAIGSIIASTAEGFWGGLLAAVVAAVLMLRARSYANGSQAIALLTSGMVTLGGFLIAWLWTATPSARLLYIFGLLLILGVLGLVLGVVFPNQRFSPVLRRSVDIGEAVLIAAVLPLALGVMKVYDYLRHVNLG